MTPTENCLPFIPYHETEEHAPSNHLRAIILDFVLKISIFQNIRMY